MDTLLYVEGSLGYVVFNMKEKYLNRPDERKKKNSFCLNVKW